MPSSDLLTASAFCWLAWAIYWWIAARFVKATKSSEGWLQRAGHLIPPILGFLLIFHGGQRTLVYGFLFHAQWVRLLGLGLTIAGLLFAVWARVHLGKYWSGIITVKEGHELIRTGPYQFVCHPIYTGFLLAALGSALTARTGDAAAGFAIILVAYLLKVRREEAVLSREFGEQYLAFKRNVSALCPFVY